MKIREGFVSNSSSSSFLLYGVYSGDNSDIKLSNKIIVAAEEDGEYEALYQVIQNQGLALDIYQPGDSGWYVGLSWCCVSDNETGLQFKERVTGELNKLFGEGNYGIPGTYSESWYG